MLKPIRRLIQRWEKWQDWKQYSKYSPVKNFLIFLHVIDNSWFENFVDWRN